MVARWVIDAGRSSLLKRQLDLVEAVEHDVNAVWFRMNAKIDMGTWSDDAEWRGTCAGRAAVAGHQPLDGSRVLDLADPVGWRCDQRRHCRRWQAAPAPGNESF